MLSTHCKKIVIYILLVQMEKALVIDVADDDVYKMDYQWHVSLRSSFGVIVVHHMHRHHVQQIFGVILLTE